MFCLQIHFLRSAICDFDLKIKILLVRNDCIYFQSESIHQSITGKFCRYYEKCNI